MTNQWTDYVDNPEKADNYLANKQLQAAMERLPLLKNTLANKDLNKPLHLKYTILSLTDEIIRLRGQ